MVHCLSSIAAFITPNYLFQCNLQTRLPVALSWFKIKLEDLIFFFLFFISKTNFWPVDQANTQYCFTVTNFRTLLYTYLTYIHNYLHSYFFSYFEFTLYSLIVTVTLVYRVYRTLYLWENCFRSNFKTSVRHFYYPAIYIWLIISINTKWMSGGMF